MGLLAPAALLFAGLFVPVIAMYFIRQQREREILPTIALWTRFVKEQMEARRLQRFQNNLLLWLQLALMAALIAALARPFRRGASTPGHATVIVLDASASMQSQEEDGDRFSQAKAQIRDFVGNAGGGDSLMLVAAGPRPWVAQGLTQDPRAIEQALDALVCTDGAADLEAALRAAAQVAGPGTPPAIHVWTDGAGDVLTGAERLSLPVEWHRVGDTDDNVAITALAVRRRPDNPLDLDVFTTVQNTGSAARRVAISLSLGRRVLAAKNTTLQPDETVTLTEPILAGRGGIVRVDAKTTDALQVDNSAALMLDSSKRIHVVLVSQGSAFLQRVLGLIPGVEVTTARPGEPVNPHTTDLVVYDRWLPPSWPRETALVFGPRPGPLMTKTTPVRLPRVTTWQRDHPLLHRLTFADVHVGRAAIHPQGGGATPLVASNEGALIWEQRANGARQIVVGFDLQQSDWILRPSFPLFLANVIDDIREATGQATIAARVGESIRLPVSLEVTEAEVRYPDGTTRTIGVRDVELAVDDTWRAGVYEINAPQLSSTQVVSAVNPRESDIAPRALPESNEVQTQLAGAGITREYWPWLIALALFCSLVEWTLYHRRGL